MLNKVLMVGHLCKDPEFRYTPSGAAVCNLRLASNHVTKTKTGEKKEEVCYMTIVVWNKRAEYCSQQLKKGSPVFVEGRLQSRSWENTDGKKQYATEIVAEYIQFLYRAKEGTTPEAGQEPEKTSEEAWLDSEQ